MKCITDGKVVRRVSDKEADHYVNREGWSYCQKKKKESGFVCRNCGARYSEKPEKCHAMLLVPGKTKTGKEEKAKKVCGCDKFVKETFYIPVWK